MTRLSHYDIFTIRQKYSEGSRQIDLASTFGVTQNYISKLVLGRKRSTIKKQPIFELRCTDCNTPILKGRKCATCKQKRYYCHDCNTLLEYARQRRCTACHKQHIRIYQRNYKRAMRSLKPKESEKTR